MVEGAGLQDGFASELYHVIQPMSHRPLHDDSSGRPPHGRPDILVVPEPPRFFTESQRPIIPLRASLGRAHDPYRSASRSPRKHPASSAGDSGYSAGPSEPAPDRSW